MLHTSKRTGIIMSLPDTTNAAFAALVGDDFLPVVNVCVQHTFVMLLTSIIVAYGESCVNSYVIVGHRMSASPILF